MNAQRALGNENAVFAALSLSGPELPKDVTFTCIEGLGVWFAAADLGVTASRIARRMSTAVMATIVLLGFVPGQASAQPRDSQAALRLVVAYPPGGTADIIARVMADPLSKTLARPVIVENRPGANGNIAADQVAKSSHDGLQLLVSAPGPLAVNASLYPGLPFDPSTAFTPIARVAVAPLLLVVPRALPVANLTELTSYLAANPDKAIFASQGNASSGHLAMELLKSRTGIKAIHVPYKGSAPALNDLLAGHVTMMFDNVSSSLPHIRAGTLRAIAVAEPVRLSSLPEVPTVAESGVAGFSATPWFGIAAKRGISEEMLSRVNTAIHLALESDPVRRRFAEIGIEAVQDTPATFSAYVVAEREKWSAIVRTSGARAD